MAGGGGGSEGGSLAVEVLEIEGEWNDLDVTDGRDQGGGGVAEWRWTVVWKVRIVDERRARVKFH
jgi:hypothetical protein